MTISHTDSNHRWSLFHGVWFFFSDFIWKQRFKSDEQRRLNLTLLPEWRSSFMKTKTTLVNTSCGRYLVWKSPVTFKQPRCWPKSPTAHREAIYTSKVTVKTKDSRLYLQRNLLVTANLSYLHLFYTIYLCTKCWWPKIRRLLALDCAITL